MKEKNGSSSAWKRKTMESVVQSTRTHEVVVHSDIYYSSMRSCMAANLSKESNPREARSGEIDVLEWKFHRESQCDASPAASQGL